MPTVSQSVTLAAATLLVVLSPRPAAAKGGAFRESAHGQRASGVQRVPWIARGECSHCHGRPRNAVGERSEGEGHARLFLANDNPLCVSCHAHPAGTWLGDERYQRSAHGTEPGVVWPGPQPRGREARDANKCVNCHDPHGVKDARGLVPSLLRLRGAALCLGCHGGNPGSDVASAFGKPYRHPLVQDAPADAAGTAPLAGSAVLDAANGAGTCAACHNPHAAEGGDLRSAAEASPPLAGVTRARVSNGLPGAAPLQTLADRADRSPVLEHEVCLKCHSPGALRPARTAAVAVALNPANPSYHPVQATGRNRFIDRRAFAFGWGPERLVTCSDCHGSDDGVTRGPHGSSFPHILRARYVARGVDEPMMETDLCFRCHGYGTYGDPLGGDAAVFSRFPTHALHGAKGYSCGSCHEAHGSAERAALVLLRSPGMIGYAQTPTGGSCTTTCHVQTRPDATYASPYAR